MSDHRLRKHSNKVNPKRNAEFSKKRKEAAGTASSFFTASFIWAPILVSIALYSFLKPTPYVNFIKNWIGVSENYIVAQDSPVALLPADLDRRRAIESAFKHSWHAYVRDAFGDDEYHPIDKRGSNLTKAGGIGYMVVDVLDTMQIMRLDEEYLQARQWVAEKLSFERDDVFSTFETTIRVLGGLLSAYNLSGGDELYLEKATDLADRMMPAFATEVGIPLPLINLARRQGYHTNDFPGLTSIAEVATLQLEFRYLTHLTGNDKYWKAVNKVMKIVKQNRLPHGLSSVFLRVKDGQYEKSVIRLGSRGDSFYEYLLKQYLQTNNSEDVYREMYMDAMDAIHSTLIQTSMGTKMTYTSELVPENGADGELTWRLTPKQDHLVCFLGGSLMLGAARTGALAQSLSVPPNHDELSEKGRRDWQTGLQLIETCMNTHDTATGLAPEIVYFRVPSDGMDAIPNAPSDWYIKGAPDTEFPPYDARYMLRPETVESLFIAYRLTGDQRYRDYGWKVFQSIERHCRVESGGYSSIINVDRNPALQEDKMETFFLSETLKYLYLLFDSSDAIPLDRYVLNTEAHPLPIFDPPRHLMWLQYK